MSSPSIVIEPPQQTFVRTKYSLFNWAIMRRVLRTEQHMMSVRAFKGTSSSKTLFPVLTLWLETAALALFSFLMFRRTAGTTGLSSPPITGNGLQGNRSKATSLNQTFNITDGM